MNSETVIQARGQPIDETLNSFMLAVQGVKINFEKVNDARRRSVFHANVVCVPKLNEEPLFLLVGVSSRNFQLADIEPVALGSN
ncbi:hypothetical protein Cob_v010207 [Colletotrichum orbiculare MAFF 240422]|uniref:Uncharacterized protein n=1 Tax=Colletotrichum orbiculare (strain 104-T / ATCC 96160 / CBS 514.97 / LARS 414 / MAFF 240422) TaxID=1213857 RepID=A0A484FED1_COLOR|nr:hypothetical protein Cob_v010207 [Colletotrichum orbiculare MAFF 240422]